MYNAIGASPLIIKEAFAQIDMCILKTAADEVGYIKHWTATDEAENPAINHKASSGFLNTAWKTRKRVLQCTADTLLTEHLKQRFKLQPSPLCPICKAQNKTCLGTVIHTLSGCSDPILRSQHIHRHNAAVRLIHKALRKGCLGSKLILSHAGRDPTNEIRPSKTMPAWLLPPSTPPIPDKPDLIMLWRDNMILEHQKSLFHKEEEEYRKLEYKKPTRNKEKKLKIQELCYTSLPNINKREQEK
jgi:hypothetical protein